MSTRTQVYLTDSQREAIDELRKREHRSLAEIVREALDSYLDENLVDREQALKDTFGSIPDFPYPSRDDWDRGYG